MSHRHLAPKLSILTLLISQAFISTSAFAAGFQLNELSPGLFGNALAGAAAAQDDVSAIFINPATLGTLTTNQAYLGLNAVLPQIQMTDATARHKTALSNALVAGDNNQHNVARGAIIPNGYLGYRFNDSLVAGLAVVSPYGLTTDYSDHSVVRFAALNSHVETIDIVPTLAYTFGDRFTIGAGFQAQYIKAHFSNFNGPYFNSPIPDGLFAATQRTHLNANDWGYGYTLGALFKAPCTRIGLGFRSQISHHLDGSGQQFIVPGNDPTGPQPPAGLFNADTSVKGDVTTPAVLHLGAAQDFVNWTLKASVQYNFWSSFEKLSIDMPEAYGRNVTIQTKWRDTWFGSVGADYRPSDQWTLRGGVAYDQTPTRDEYRDPRIPDSDRYWLTLGASYQINKCFSVDGSYAHVFGKPGKVDVVQASGTNANGQGPLETNQVYAKYKSNVDIIGLALRYNF